MGGIETDDGHKVMFVYESSKLLPVPGTKVTVTGIVIDPGMLRADYAGW